MAGMMGSERHFPLGLGEDKVMTKLTCKRSDCFFWFENRCSHICGIAPKRCALFLSIKASASSQILEPTKASYQPAVQAPGQ